MNNEHTVNSEQCEIKDSKRIGTIISNKCFAFNSSELIFLFIFPHCLWIHNPSAWKAGPLSGALT